MKKFIVFILLLVCNLSNLFSQEYSYKFFQSEEYHYKNGVQKKSESLKKGTGMKVKFVNNKRISLLFIDGTFSDDSFYDSRNVHLKVNNVDYELFESKPYEFSSFFSDETKAYQSIVGISSDKKSALYIKQKGKLVKKNGVDFVDVSNGEKNICIYQRTNEPIDDVIAEVKKVLPKGQHKIEYIWYKKSNKKTNSDKGSIVCIGNEIRRYSSLDVNTKSFQYNTTEYITLISNEGTLFRQTVPVFTSKSGGIYAFIKQTNGNYIYIDTYEKNNEGKFQYSMTYVISQSANSKNGHEYVDLGLSVKWATCNVGANSPEEYGDYFAWGETKPKSTYNYTNCFDCLDSKGNNWNTYKIGGKTQITPTSGHDTARENWGGSWRMPTYTECDELCKKCKWTWTSINGHNGYTVTGPNGNCIFLPAAGHRYSIVTEHVDVCGYYWSSTLHSEFSDFARSLSLNSSDHMAYNYGRGDGQSVRPVTD